MGIFDSKSFNPMAFKYVAERIQNLNTNAIVKSGALSKNPDIQNIFANQNGSVYAKLAMRGLVDGDAVNYDGQTDIVATTTKTFEQGVIVVGRAKGWLEKDFSFDVTSGEDFMQNIAEQVSEYQAGLDQETILAMLKGVFAMGQGEKNSKNAEFVSEHTHNIADKVDGNITSTTLNTATNKACGANKKKISLVFMHSDIATNLENLNLITYLKQTDADGIQRDLSLGTWNGKLVVIDDNMPIETKPAHYVRAKKGDVGALKVIAASGSPKDGEIKIDDTEVAKIDGIKAGEYVLHIDESTIYTTYALGKGSIAFEDIGAKVPYEISRDPKTNGGEDTLYMRQRKAIAPFGLSYEKAEQASLSPTNAELENGKNWALVHSGEKLASDRTFINHKAIPICRIISRG